MQTASCDVCRKKVDNPFNDRTFFYVGAFSLCESCKDGLESHIKPTIRNKDPFAIDWYQKLICDSLDKAVQKGRI